MNNHISERRIKNNKLRRIRQIRRNIFMSTMTLILILSFSVIFFSFGSKAQSDKVDDVSYKYYKSVSVGVGDTLWGYAELYAMDDYYDNYNSYIKEVMEINHLKNDNIVYGQHIILPYFCNEFVR